MAAPRRWPGPSVAASSQVSPSHTQVQWQAPPSCAQPVGASAAAPPNSTTRSRPASQARAGSTLALGPTSAATVHCSPSHSQVQPQSSAQPSSQPSHVPPPKRTTLPRRASQTIPACERACGPSVAATDPARPSHSHVPPQ